MYKEILRSIAGIEVFPVVSLVLFVTVFTASLVQVIRMTRSHVDRLARLPLDGDPSTAHANANAQEDRR